MGQCFFDKRGSAEGIGSQILADIEVTSAMGAQTNIDITGLNIQKGDLIELSADIICNANSDYSLFVNGNITATNYYRQKLNVDSATTTPLRTNNSVFVTCANTNKAFVNIIIELTNSGYFVYQADSIGRYGSSTINLENDYTSLISTLTSITSLRISGVTNSIGVGSRFILKKVGGN